MLLAPVLAVPTSTFTIRLLLDVGGDDNDIFENDHHDKYTPYTRPL